jgi:hypothetical protein
VRLQDAALQHLVTFLNAQVGRGRWAMVLTADHGAIPSPKVSGGFQISTAPIGAGLNAAFDTDGDDVPIVQLIQPTQIYVNLAELRQNGGTLEEMARWIMARTEGDTHGIGVVVPPDRQNDPVFAASFPSELMQHLDCLPEARG